MKRIFGLLIALVMVLGFSVQAHATLTTIGTATYSSTDYNLIYDDDLGITWLGYSSPINTWNGQRSWATGLNSAGVLTYNLNPGVTMSWTDDWRLPTALNQDGSGPCFGYCTGSEMGHLFYDELGGTSGLSILTSGDPDLALFSNLQPNYYWSGTEDALVTNFAWTFGFSGGVQGYNDKANNFYALAVRPGDVSAVPEPGTMFLLGSGLVGLAAFRKRFGRIDR